jgi:hypothetical protein
MEKSSKNDSLIKENERLRKHLKDSELQRIKERFILQKLDLFNDNAPMAVIEWDLETRVIEWNKSAENIFGYTKKEAIGKYASEIIIPISLKKEIDKIRKLLFNNTRGYRSTNENITKSGETIICEWYNVPLVNDNGDILGVSSMVLDISEKVKAEKELKKSNARFKMLSDLSFEGIAIHIDGVVIEANSSIEHLTQYSREEIIGNNIIELLVVDEYIPLIYKNIKNKWRAPYEVEIRRKDGTIIWVEIEAESYHYNGQDLRAAAVRDVSLRKKNEQKLQKALYEAQESERLKSTFLSNISHELRTPLNAVIGFSDLIDESMDITEAANLAKMIFKSGNHLLDILNDIFALSMLEEGTMILFKQEHDLHTLLDEVQEFISLEKRKTNKEELKLVFNFDINKNPQINTDQKHFKQILIHLLKNALKYTKKGVVELGYNIVPNAYEFYVKDTGIGIPEEKQKHIFDHFRQLDDRHTREYEGLGIGLSIAKTLCENLGGEISVKSEEGKGSTFYFMIPRKKKNFKISSISSETSDDLSILNGKTILIAEDDISSYELIEMHLKPWEVKILWAKNGIEAIDIFERNEQIDLILMDIKMPKLSGYEAIKKIKKTAPLVPIIAQTAYAINDEKEFALEAGCDDYVSKPINWKVLLEKMVQQLQKAKKQS